MQPIDEHNKVHQPFVWTKPVIESLEKIDGACDVLANAQLIHYSMLDTVNDKERIVFGAKR